MDKLQRTELIQQLEVLEARRQAAADILSGDAWIIRSLINRLEAQDVIDQVLEGLNGDADTPQGV